MGKTLKTIDILGKIEDETEKQHPKDQPGISPTDLARTHAEGIQSPDRNNRPHYRGRANQKEVAQAAAGKPSAYQADLRQKLRDKVQLNFAAVPRFIREEYERLAAKEGMNMREFLYHLLREKGADIPPYEDMDGRKL